MNLQEGIEALIDELQATVDFTNTRIEEAKEAGIENCNSVHKWIGMSNTLEVCISKLEILLDTGSL